MHACLAQFLCGAVWRDTAQTMSKENVEIVRRVYEAAARRDPTAIFALYDPQVEWDMSQHPYGEMSKGRVYHGHAGLRDWFSEWYEAFDDFEHDREDLVEVGEHVISVGTDRGRGRASGADVRWNGIAGVWTIRHGKVVRVVWFRTREEALDAVGLSE